MNDFTCEWKKEWVEGTIINVEDLLEENTGGLDLFSRSANEKNLSHLSIYGPWVMALFKVCIQKKTDVVYGVFKYISVFVFVQNLQLKIILLYANENSLVWI